MLIRVESLGGYVITIARDRGSVADVNYFDGVRTLEQMEEMLVAVERTITEMKRLKKRTARKVRKP